MSKGKRTPLYEVETKAQDASRLLDESCVKHHICGSIRRGTKAMVGDIDIVVNNLQKACVALDYGYIAEGRKKVDFLWKDMQINLYVATEAEWGAMMLFLTGNAFFNRIMRARAIKMGDERKQRWKLNQYGLWVNDVRIAGYTEEDVFLGLGMRIVPPSEREK